ncbi:unnamed protein product [Mytilus coruscus]|uniref:Uncharacterized protein n=1 Tax=Mytilus coruscus TaxID=42192 RepID=A0A6J8ALL7_MYTCO|nr:unnamed protein product [Mytilus coruscus]
MYHWLCKHLLALFTLSNLDSELTDKAVFSDNEINIFDGIIASETVVDIEIPDKVQEEYQTSNTELKERKKNLIAIKQITNGVLSVSSPETLCNVHMMLMIIDSFLEGHIPNLSGLPIRTKIQGQKRKLDALWCYQCGDSSIGGACITDTADMEAEYYRRNESLKNPNKMDKVPYKYLKDCLNTSEICIIERNEEQGQAFEDFYCNLVEKAQVLSKPEHEVLSKFINGLPDKMTFFVRAGNPTTLQAALTSSKMAEACGNRTEGIVTKAIKTEAKSRPDPTTKSEMDDLKDQIKTLTSMVANITVHNNKIKHQITDAKTTASHQPTRLGNKILVNGTVAEGKVTFIATVIGQELDLSTHQPHVSYVPSKDILHSSAIPFSNSSREKTKTRGTGTVVRSKFS